MASEWSSTAPRGKSVPAQHLESQRSNFRRIKFSWRSTTAYLDDTLSTHLKILNNLKVFTFQNNEEHIFFTIVALQKYP